MRTDERLKVIYEVAVSMVTRTPESWAQYLAFAARIYKYPFDNALLIYAQDPNVTMLATKEIWKRVGRDPVEQTKLIAVCEYKDAKNSLKYLLDVSQTSGNTVPNQWEVDENMQTPLALALSERYNLSTPYLSMAVGQLVYEAMEQSFEQCIQDFELDIDGHFFSELPKDGLYTQIREIIEASARIFISFRCGVPSHDSDIQALSTISHFDTVPLAARLGNIVTDVSKHILLEIERTVKTIERERSKHHGEQIEPDIYRERWPALPEHQHQGRYGKQQPARGQIRTGLDEQPVPKTPPEVYNLADDRQTGGNRPESRDGSPGTTGSNFSATISEKSPTTERRHNGESSPPDQPASNGRGNRYDGNRDETEITTELPSLEKEPQGSFSLPEIKEKMTAVAVIPTPTYGTKNMSDKEYQIGYEYILTSTAMYPETMYTSIRKHFDTDLEISEKAQVLSEIYHQYGNAELKEDILYRTVLREDGGLSFYIGDGYTYMPWFTIAVIIEALIGDGKYPILQEPVVDDLSERIGSYNIPDEINEMNDPEIAVEDDYNLTGEELYARVDGFLSFTYILRDGWQEEMATEISKVQPDKHVLFDLFRDIEEKALSINNSYIECFAFEDHVTIRVDNVDLDFSYPELIQQIKSLIEIGDFAGETNTNKTSTISANEQSSEDHTETEQHEQGKELEDIFPLSNQTSTQHDFKNEDLSPTNDTAQLITTTDILHSDEIDISASVPKQLDLFSFNPDDNDSEETPDASFALDEGAADRDNWEETVEPVTELDPPETRKIEPAIKRHHRINYRYSTDDNLYPPGAKTKYHNNTEAIRLLQRIESERRLATADEQKILARYVGWGGIADAFNPKAAGWDKEYRELKLALDEKDYAQARDSILTAYYTDPELIYCIYDALTQFGFTDGKNRSILDPAMGTGNFYSVLPEQLQNARLTGVEIDSITGRLARQLYQTVDIQITGFETSKIENDSYDIAIGNVPFNEIKIYDRRYDDNYYVHDYFFIRILDSLKPGGIAIFITSKGTMDKIDTSARKEIAQRADLIGAIRLPNDTFKALAGTEVTTDILFLKKPEHRRNVPKEQLPDWVFTDTRRSDYMRLNQYYIDHPDMILGDMKYISGRFGRTEACVAPEGQELYPLLHNAISKLHGEFTAQPNEEITESNQEVSTKGVLKAPEGIKTYTYQIQDGKIYYCSDGKLHPQDITGKKAERIIGLCGIRDALRTVIDIQSSDILYDPVKLRTAQAELNRLYDAFVKRNSPINDKGNILAFSDDDTFPLLRSIEDYDKKSDTWNKSPVFLRATIRPNRLPEKAETALQAMQISLNVKQKVDIPFMAKLYNRSPEEVIAELGDKIYLNPQKYYGNPYEGWELDEEYLSGYVKDKLAYAKLREEDNPELFSRNVKALQAVQPIDLLPGDIEYSIGTPWIPLEYYTQFMYENFGTYERHKGTENHCINVKYMEYSNQWFITGKQQENASVKVNKSFGTSRKNAYEIFEDTLNLQSVTIRDKVRYIDVDGKEKEKYVVNAKETMIARGKQQQIREIFRDWLFKDKDRSDALLKIYNNTFNNIVPRTYDGNHLVFPGMSDTVQLRPHQLNVAARIIYNGTSLMGHEVGAGKTAAMVAAGMYMKQAGIINKPVYVVPNHLINQWANEFLRFFPGASLLVTSEKDFEKKNRQQFVSKIAMGEYDGIIISHSQFEKISMSREQQENMLTDEINHLSYVLNQIKAEKGENWSIKQIVIFQKRLIDKLERLVNADKKDDLIDFEALGIDYMFIEERNVSVRDD